MALAEKTDWSITVLDKLTYAGNRANLTDCEATGRVRLVHGDICDTPLLADLVPGHDVIFNFAAESHVDRSIQDAVDFVRTDVEGTRALLEAARLARVGRYIQISTDEVYGDLPGDERATPNSPLRPRSPYSASKAAGDLMVQAYRATYGLETIITRCSNNYGPFQYPEKLISLFTTNALDGKPLPLYGDGRQQRDWIHVLDHCAALLVVLERGTAGQIYNIGTEVERVNIDVVHGILAATGRDASSIRSWTTGRATTGGMRSTRPRRGSWGVAAGPRSTRGWPKPSSGTARIGTGGGRCATGRSSPITPGSMEAWRPLLPAEATKHEAAFCGPAAGSATPACPSGAHPIRFRRHAFGWQPVDTRSVDLAANT